MSSFIFKARRMLFSGAIPSDVPSNSITTISGDPITTISGQPITSI